jgi:hypothetical protein
LQEIHAAHDDAADASLREEARAQLPQRRRAFARQFEDIALECTGSPP